MLKGGVGKKLPRLRPQTAKNRLISFGKEKLYNTIDIDTTHL